MPSGSAKPWSDLVLDTLKANDVRLAVYVPDKILIPVIDGVRADPFFTAVGATREEEGVGICAGAWMGGMRSILLMQTSGFATLANSLASLPVPYQIPTLMMVSERGTLGEFNIGQQMVARTMRPVLDTLLIESPTITRIDELQFILDRAMTQAWATQSPCCFILSPLLTGGKVFAA